jgi:lantibiotic modifying enzyme
MPKRIFVDSRAFGVGGEMHMSKKRASSRFQEVIEAVETLPPDDQELLIAIIRQRLIQHRRAELAAEIAEARRAYQQGEIRRGTVADLMEELAE